MSHLSQLFSNFSKAFHTLDSLILWNVNKFLSLSLLVMMANSRAPTVDSRREGGGESKHFCIDTEFVDYSGKSSVFSRRHKSDNTKQNIQTVHVADFLPMNYGTKELRHILSMNYKKKLNQIRTMYGNSKYGKESNVARSPWTKLYCSESFFLPCHGRSIEYFYSVVNITFVNSKLSPLPVQQHIIERTPLCVVEMKRIIHLLLLLAVPSTKYEKKTSLQLVELNIFFINFLLCSVSLIHSTLWIFFLPLTKQNTTQSRERGKN